MPFPVLILLLTACVAGCTGHSCREEGDRIHFYLRDTGAAEVYFASSLDGFELHRLGKTVTGAWEATVPKKESFQYFYRVDGKTYLPDCPFHELDDFGLYNCQYRTDR
jgi:hypothetical protein